jgi:hypothetical protein
MCRVRRYVGGGPLAIAVLEEIAGMVAGDRLEENTHAAILLGQVEAGAEQAGRLSRVARHGEDEARNVSQDGDRVVIVEVTAEPTLGGEAGDPDNHSVVVLPVGEETQGGCLATQLVLGVVKVGEVLDLGYWHVPGQPRPERDSQDGLLVEQGVEHPEASETLAESAGDSIHPTLDGNVLAKEQGLRVDGHQVRERGIDGLGQGHPRFGLRHAVTPDRGAVLGGKLRL